MTQRVSSATTLLPPNSAEVPASSCCLWNIIEAIFEWLGQIFCCFSTSAPATLENRAQIIETCTFEIAPSPIQAAVVSEETPQPYSPAANHLEEEEVTQPPTDEQVAHSPPLATAMAVHTAAEEQFTPPEKPFSKCMITIEEGSLQKEITSFKELDALVCVLEPVINGAHQTLSIRHSYKGGFASREVSELWEYLEKHFEVEHGFNQQLILKPKIEKREEVKEEGRLFTVITYRNGVVHRLTSLNDQFDEGERIFPAGIIGEDEVIDRGVFLYTEALCDGTRTTSHHTIHVFSNQLIRRSFRPLLFKKSQCALIWDGTAWRVGQRVRSDRRMNEGYIVDDTVTPFEWLMQNPTPDTIEALGNPHFSEGLTLEQKQKIIHSFLTAEEGQIPPIFNLGDYYVMSHFLRLAAECGVAVDFSLTHPETLQPLLIQWILFLTDMDAEDPFSDRRKNEWSALLSQAGELIVQMSEEIFEDLMARESFFLHQFVLSDWSFKEPKNQVLYEILKSDSLVSSDLFNALSLEEKREIYRISNHFQKWGAAEQMETLAGDLLKVKLKGPGHIEGNPVLGSVALIDPSMSVPERKKSVQKFLEELRQKGLLLTETEYKSRSLNCMHKHANIGRILGRDYMQRAIDALGLKKVKVPPKYAVLSDEEANISVTLSDHSIKSNLAVYAEIIETAGRLPTYEEVEELFQLLEATAYVDLTVFDRGRRYLGGNVIVGADALWVIDTEFKDFGDVPYYDKLTSLQDYLQSPEDRERLAQHKASRVAAYKNCEADVLKAREEKAQLRSECKKLFGREHSFKFDRTLLFGEVPDSPAST